MCFYRDVTKAPGKKLVHNVKVGCTEGQVMWRFPYGGLRLSFTPPTDDDVTYDVCCVVSVTYCDVTLSLDGGDTLRVIGVLNSSSDRVETCFQWSRHRALSLYVVSLVSQMSLIAGRLDVDYDVRMRSRDMRGAFPLLAMFLTL